MSNEKLRERIKAMEKGKKTRRYTVVGLYEDTAQVWTGAYDAENQNEAMILASVDIVKDDNGDNVQIVCAVAGDQVIFPPGEETGKAAYACDLAAIREDA